MKKIFLAIFCCVFALSAGCDASKKKKKDTSKKSRKARYEMVTQFINR